MAEIFAKDFDIVSSYDVKGGEPLHVREITGKDGFISVYGIKKTTCRIEGKTEKAADERVKEIIDFTKSDRKIERKLYEENLGYEVEYNSEGNEVPRFTDKGKERQYKNYMTGKMEPVYVNNKLVPKVDEDFNVLPKYDCEGKIIPLDKRPEVNSLFEELEKLTSEGKIVDGE